MTSASKDRKDQVRLGFMTAIEIVDRTFVGGLLVTDRFGRPLEFQCTTPVKPNRTQELLYGPTLVPFILGELLGKTLLDRISVKPTLVLTSRVEMLQLRPTASLPVLFDEASSPSDSSDTATRTEVQKDQQVRFGRQTFRMHKDFLSDRAIVERIALELSDDANMHEPLQRVGEALRETMSTVAVRPRVA
ncbi:MAG: hypothetical protein O3B13_03750 [Planctomycetota bacterium]|nr:hypothetical protein [Planctomycetota bacterium]MDA1162195.1 hypothetical protein [Planctomycetota bacterium]